MNNNVFFDYNIFMNNSSFANFGALVNHNETLLKIVIYIALYRVVFKRDQYSGSVNYDTVILIESSAFKKHAAFF